jgi:hypothetical protein
MRLSKGLTAPVTGSIGLSREWDDDCAALCLSSKVRGLDPDRLVRVRLVNRIESSRSRVKGAPCGG